MDVKFGALSSNTKSNFFINPSDASMEENLFASNNENQEALQKQNSSSGKLNDYDSNLLENNAYQSMKDEVFKIEYKIAQKEEILSKITSEIDAIEGLGYDIQLSGLKERKKELENELKILSEQYSQSGLASNLSGKLTSAVKFAKNEKQNFAKKMKTTFVEKVLVKISKKIGYKQSLSEALTNLENINVSVDELIKMQVPYGETVNRYQKLTAYINKANTIHSQITRNVNKIQNKGN